MPIMAARPLRSSFSWVHMPLFSALVGKKGTEPAVRRAMARMICVVASPNCWCGLARGDLRARGGDEADHGEAAVHELGAGAREVGALGAGERERLLEGERRGRGGDHGLGGRLLGGLGGGLLGRLTTNAERRAERAAARAMGAATRAERAEVAVKADMVVGGEVRAEVTDDGSMTSLFRFFERVKPIRCRGFARSRHFDASDGRRVHVFVARVWFICVSRRSSRPPLFSLRPSRVPLGGPRCSSRAFKRAHPPSGARALPVAPFLSSGGPYMVVIFHHMYICTRAFEST